MRHIAVIGLGFGDEGKGLTVSSIAKRTKPEETLVVRYSGGQQAGHTVVDKGVKHVFSNFGSATMQGVPTLWSEYCTFDPVGVMKEYKILVKKGFKPKLYVSPDCPITTPYEKYISNANMLDGTCGTGVGNTKQREEDFHSLKTGDMLFRSVFKMKYDLLEGYYSTYPLTKEPTEFLNAVQFILNCDDIIILKNRDYNIFDLPEEIGTIIYESSQGLLLDQHFGFFPHVTRSDLGMKNIEILATKLGGKINNIIENYLVTRAYQTRHGNGPMTNEDKDLYAMDNPHETNVNNEYQGEFRRTLLDLDLLAYAMSVDKSIQVRSFQTLVITHLDLVQDALQYTIGGITIHHDSEDDFVWGIMNHLGIDDNKLVRDPQGF